ncbi:hypothetical protein Ciccas_006637 [Cichlidogyrus casuarinus]|uniref:Uncharacterized protein n=1 Tax=Cichlidogyrus casuarinus TaxID=1844966 RepID=A0ABD2Q571_9PLAT
MTAGRSRPILAIAVRDFSVKVVTNGYWQVSSPSVPTIAISNARQVKSVYQPTRTGYKRQWANQ